MSPKPKTYRVGHASVTIAQIITRTGLSEATVWRTLSRQRDAGRPLEWADFPKPKPAARKPTAAQQVRIVRPPQAPATGRGAAQTVEEFLAAGGRIQHLPRHHTANPLRFDHSDTATPTGRRRPVMRAQKAATL